MTTHPDPVVDPVRLAAVRSTGLLDTEGEETFDRLTRLAARVLGTPYAFVTLVDDRRSFWKSCFGVDAEDPADRQNPVEESFCQYVVASTEPLVLDDVTTDSLTKDNPSIELMGVRAWAGYPIVDALGNVLGTVCAVDTEVHPWSDEDRELLALLAASAGAELQLRARADRADVVADQLRRGLLPPVLPLVPGVDVAAVHRSANGRRSVLGDFYDLFQSSGGRWHALVGDVCGSGPEAATQSSIVRWSFQSLADQLDDPEEMFDAVNSVLLRQPDSRFVTGQAVAFAEPERGMLRLDFASAGHHPALLRRSDGSTEPVTANGWMLGVFDGYRRGGTRLELGPGEVLLMFTDGVLEARRSGEPFGPERAERIVRDLGPDPYELAHGLVDAAAGHADDRTADDMAVLAVSPQPPS